MAHVEAAVHRVRRPADARAPEAPLSDVESPAAFPVHAQLEAALARARGGAEEQAVPPAAQPQAPVLDARAPILVHVLKGLVRALDTQAAAGEGHAPSAGAHDPDRILPNPRPSTVHAV